MRLASFLAFGLASAAGFVACATGELRDGFDSSDASAVAKDGASATFDGATNDDASSSSDASTKRDADAASDGSSGTDASTGLDPDLKLPGAGGTACSQPGLWAGCPSVQICRIASTTGGRCESCAPCGNLNAACTESSQCDIIFQCYKGHCTNFCTLGTSECGAPADCIDVGNATTGVCNPL